MRKRIITIGGKPGSGKSTTVRALAQILGYDHFSSGGFMRDLAKARGMSIDAFNTFAESNPEIDHMVDEKLRTLGATEENLIIDSRLAFHWIPDAFKVYLDLPTTTAAQRIFADQNAERIACGETPVSEADAITRVEERITSEQLRYKTLYNIDPYDPAHFDLVIDTSTQTPEAVANHIATAYRTWLEADT